MQHWNKYILGALAGMGLASAAHAYGPGSPATATVVPQGFTLCATDGKVCKVPTGAATVHVYYGAGTKFGTALGTGDFTCLPRGWVKSPSPSTPQDLGIDDPAPNVAKSCYMQVAGATPPDAPSPEKLKADMVKAEAAKSPTIPRCWWWDNKTGKWIDSPLPVTKEDQCKTLDACTPEGGKAAGAGCYKWSTPEKVNEPAVWSPPAKPVAPAAPAVAPTPTVPTKVQAAASVTPTPAIPRGTGILSCWWWDNKTGKWSEPVLPVKTEDVCKTLDACTPEGGKASGAGCYKWSTPEKVNEPAVWSKSEKTVAPAAAAPATSTTSNVKK